LGVSPQLQLLLAIPMSAIATALLLGRYQPSAHRTGGSMVIAPRFAAPSGPILVLVGVTVCAMLMEGASMDWSAIYMRNVFAAGPFVAGFAVVAFAFCQAGTRFFADRFVEKYSPT